MPVLVAIAIRYIIMAAVQLGLWTLLEKYGIPLLNGAIEAIMKAFGVSEEVAKDIMANKVLLAFEEVGIFAVTLKTKLPIKVAELLGFTSKGFVLRKLSPTIAAKVETTALSATQKVVTTTADVESIAVLVAKGGKANVTAVKSLFGQLTGALGLTALWYLALINTIDFANWQGAYQKTFQKIFTFLGFPPDTPMPKANTLSAETWKRIYSTIETLDPVGINDPFSDIDRPYSRANLASFIDKMSANIVKNGGQATYKNVIGLVLPMIQLRGQPDLTKMDKLNFDTIFSASTGSSTKATSNVVSKVFTGIVSQGVVQPGLTFEARQDDLIEDIAELKAAASNNLAPFLQALPGKVIYEVKIVSSITTKEGFIQRGTTQKIQTGTTTTGQPKYKTVTNKFATLVLYILNDKRTRTKISTIVLGPVDSARFQVQQGDLAQIETELPKLVTTSDISEITGIVSSTPVTTVSPQAEAIPEKKTPRLGETRYYHQTIGGTDEYITRAWGGNVFYGDTPVTKEEYIKGLTAQLERVKEVLTRYTRDSGGIVTPKPGANAYDLFTIRGFPNEKTENEWKQKLNDAINNVGIFAPDYNSGEYAKFQTYAPVPMEQYYSKEFFSSLPSNRQAQLRALYPNYNFELDTTPVVSANTTQSATTTTSFQTGVNATTLSEWYQALGQNLPSIEVRSKLYEKLGLGQASYYTGTAEQNTKLLKKLNSVIKTVDDTGEQVTVIMTVDDTGAVDNATFYLRNGSYFQLLPNGTYLKVTNQTILNRLFGA